MSKEPSQLAIWCLFSIENNYDQPDNNLVAFWHSKPSIEKIAEALGVKMDEAADEAIITIVNIYAGKGECRFDNTDFSLNTVEPGQVLS